VGIEIATTAETIDALVKNIEDEKAELDKAKKEKARAAAEAAAAAATL